MITAGPPDSTQCAENLATSIAVCRPLGLPLHPDKCNGPSTHLVVLGIELHSVAQVACLPKDKLWALQTLQFWRGWHWCIRHELESLIGHLHHPAKVVRPGHTFLRQITNLLQCFRKWGNPIRLNSEFHLDLQWWLQFLSSSHGVYFWFLVSRHVCLPWPRSRVWCISFSSSSTYIQTDRQTDRQTHTDTHTHIHTYILYLFIHGKIFSLKKN